MFFLASSMNSIVKLNTTNVVNMNSMFANANAFNKPITPDSANNYWITSNVKDMTAMFANANAFNNGGTDTIALLDTSSVTNMSGMFQGASSFNQDISGWDVGNVTSASVFSGSCPIDGTAYSPFYANASGTFSYTFTYTGSGNDDVSTYLPIINGSNSFSLTTTYTNQTPTNGQTVTVSMRFNYVATGVSSDGMSFQDCASFYSASTSGLTITSFGGVTTRATEHMEPARGKYF